MRLVLVTGAVLGIVLGGAAVNSAAAHGEAPIMDCIMGNDC